MPRAFVAIDLGDPVREALTAAAGVFRADAPGWAGEKWVARENLHVTLRFLGDVPDAIVGPLGDTIAEAVARTAPFELRLAGFRSVSSARSARMLWAEFADPEGAAAALAAAVEEAVAPFSPARDVKPFRPHVTLARARHPRPAPREAVDAAEALLTAGVPPLSVTRATLYASTLTRTGPVYDLLRIFPTGRA